jgi:hypothetical protein
VNLELPFSDVCDTELDAYLARIDEQLDALFLDEVKGTLEALLAEPAPTPPAATAA